MIEFCQRKKMRWVFLFAFCILWSCTGKKEASTKGAASQDTASPKRDASGDEFHKLFSKSKLLFSNDAEKFAPLADLKKFQDLIHGKVILLNFWASWCPPCMAEMPSLLKLAKEKQGSMILILVNQDESSLEAKKFFKLFPKQSEGNLFSLTDESRIWSRTFEVFKLPETVVFDSQNKFLQKLEGSVDFSSPEFSKLLSLTEPSAKKTE